MKTFFGSNIKLLRNRKKRTQQDVADEIKVKRTTINNYENGIGQPSVENVISLADYFSINMDTLLRTNLSSLSESQITELEKGFDVYAKGSKLRVLVSTVDSSNRDNIELVSHRAKAGYTAGYNDPEFIRGLPAFQLPFLEKERKYRMFQIDGDSMNPIPHKAFVIGEYLQNWNEIKDGTAYVILTREEGIVFKVAYNQIRKKKNLLLRSLNKAYEPYEINISDISEVWKFVNYIAAELPGQNEGVSQLLEKIDELRNRAEKMFGQ